MILNFIITSKYGLDKISDIIKHIAKGNLLEYEFGQIGSDGFTYRYKSPSTFWRWEIQTEISVEYIGLNVYEVQMLTFSPIGIIFSGYITRKFNLKLANAIKEYPLIKKCDTTL